MHPPMPCFHLTAYVTLNYSDDFNAVCICAMNSANFGHNRNVKLSVRLRENKNERKGNVGNSFFLTVVVDKSEMSRRRSSEWLLYPN